MTIEEDDSSYKSVLFEIDRSYVLATPEEFTTLRSESALLREENAILKRELADVRARMARKDAALRWALPLAELAMNQHRHVRIEAGHINIVGKYKDGTEWLGIWQSEVDEIETARAALQDDVAG